MPDSGGTKALVATAGAYPKGTEREVDRRAEDQAGKAGSKPQVAPCVVSGS